MPKSDEAGRSSKRLLEYRLPEKIEFDRAYQILSTLYNDDFKNETTELGTQFRKDLDSVSHKQARYIETQIVSFLSYCLREVKRERRFEFGDCSFGNLLFAGAFLRLGNDFNRTITDLERIFNPESSVLRKVVSSSSATFSMRDAASLSSGYAPPISRTTSEHTL